MIKKLSGQRMVQLQIGLKIVFIFYSKHFDNCFNDFFVDLQLYTHKRHRTEFKDASNSSFSIRTFLETMK